MAARSHMPHEPHARRSCSAAIVACGKRDADSRANARPIRFSQRARAFADRFGVSRIDAKAKSAASPSMWRAGNGTTAPPCRRGVEFCSISMDTTRASDFVRNGRSSVNASTRFGDRSSESSLNRAQTASWSIEKPFPISHPFSGCYEARYTLRCQPCGERIPSRNAWASLTAPRSASVASVLAWTAFKVVSRFQANAFCRSGEASAISALSSQPMNTSVLVGSEMSVGVMPADYRTETGVFYGPKGAAQHGFNRGSDLSGNSYPKAGG